MPDKETFSITKDGKWLSGSIEHGKYIFVTSREHRYLFSRDRAICIAKTHPGSEVINEYSHLTIFPESDDLCSWCRCSLVYGYIEYRGAPFCSQSCVDEAIGD